MRINGHGKARVLKPNEIVNLFYEGFKRARDGAMFGLCLYTACRISEARQIHYVDVFAKGIVRDTITLRKSHTKRKLATRTIATHPNLAKLLEQYHRSSENLLELRKIYGDWSHTTSYGGVRTVCPKCGSFRTNKNGSKGGIQRYKCLKCNSHFKEVITLEQHHSIDVNSKLPPHDNLLHSAVELGELYSLNVECSDQQLVTTPDSKLPEPVGFTYPLLEKISVPPFDELGVKHSDSYGFLFANPRNPYLFPGRRSQNCITEIVINKAFNEACKRVGIEGAGTHSLRRTTLTSLHKQGCPLKVIQEISGHKRLATLQEYLEVDEDEVDAAIDSLS